MAVRPKKDAYQEGVGRSFAAGIVSVCCGTSCKPFRGSCLKYTLSMSETSNWVLKERAYKNVQNLLSAYLVSGIAVVTGRGISEEVERLGFTLFLTRKRGVSTKKLFASLSRC